MWVFLFVWAGSLAALCSPGSVCAQSNPPFSNPSLDTDCYFPQIGVPGEIDTIYGNLANEGLGAFIHKLGPMQGGMPGNILIGNGPGSPLVDWSQTATGPTFDLHNLKLKAQRLPLNPQSIRFGHFHNSTNVDILDFKNFTIYWADADGNYDSSDFTNLNSNIHGNAPVGGGGLRGVSNDGGYVLYPGYAAHLTSDTVDDIVLGFYTADSNDKQDTLYLIHFTGGSALASLKNAYEDTSVSYGQAIGYHTDHTCLQGDFRGTGREDLIIAEEQKSINEPIHLFFYRNDPPFSLQNLAQAIQFDTLTYLVPGEWITMPLLPKMEGDNSIDFALATPVDTNNSDIYNIDIFRGGPNFGSHQITIDSAAYVILPPTLGYNVWPGEFINAGDMTGTGNHVFYTLGSDDIHAYQNFYVTGQALDGKIDIYNFATAGAFGDTLTANGDSLEDFLLGLPGYASENDKSNGVSGVGSIWLMYGSKNIPVHLNPEFADVVDIPQQNGAGIMLSPNPAQTWSVATILWPEAEDGEYEVFNILGSVVQKGAIRLLGGAEQQRIYFPNLASGVYVLVIHSSSNEARAKLVIAQ